MRSVGASGASRSPETAGARAARLPHCFSRRESPQKPPRSSSEKAEHRSLTSHTLCVVIVAAAVAQDLPHQAHPRQEGEAEPPDPAVDPSAHGQHDQVQRQASPLAPHQARPVSARAHVGQRYDRGRQVDKGSLGAASASARDAAASAAALACDFVLAPLELLEPVKDPLGSSG
ncbi:hypothetical protein PHYPSEUDO_002611 [Phytophthora pseudosyringae]|uniref:Uncharacterized protein n=1 Tax=Phytophthora pseudosyringae TaxID=221518 RepID=A0A8T1VWU0_9STRA|nr:hypothetical protein PHYPSEUDO_002611 [Phytophthora pseudosyringae]